MLMIQMVSKQYGGLLFLSVVLLKIVKATEVTFKNCLARKGNTKGEKS